VFEGLFVAILSDDTAQSGGETLDVDVHQEAEVLV